MVNKKAYKIHSSQRLNAQLDFLKRKLGKHSKAQVISECVEPLFEIASQSVMPLRLVVNSENNMVSFSVSPLKIMIYSGKLTSTIQDTIGLGDFKDD